MSAVCLFEAGRLRQRRVVDADILVWALSAIAGSR